jgi:hypothetical protein
MYELLHVRARRRWILPVLIMLLHVYGCSDDSVSPKSSPPQPLQWTWQNPLPTGNTLNDVHFVDAQTGTAVGQAGTIVWTTDGGVTWVTQESGTTNDLYGVSFFDANNGTAVGDVGTILRTVELRG